MRPMTTQLKCAECNEMFEVSTEIANAMTRWRDASGEPITCGECAGNLDEIDPGPVGAVCNRTETDNDLV